jgi:hypothetical protein
MIKLLIFIGGAVFKSPVILHHFYGLKIIRIAPFLAFPGKPAHSAKGIPHDPEIHPPAKPVSPGAIL